MGCCCEIMKKMVIRVDYLKLAVISWWSRLLEFFVVFSVLERLIKFSTQIVIAIVVHVFYWFWFLSDVNMFISPNTNISLICPMWLLPQLYIPCIFLLLLFLNSSNLFVNLKTCSWFFAKYGTRMKNFDFLFSWNNQFGIMKSSSCLKEFNNTLSIKLDGRFYIAFIFVRYCWRSLIRYFRFFSHNLSMYHAVYMWNLEPP